MKTYQIILCAVFIILTVIGYIFDKKEYGLVDSFPIIDKYFQGNTSLDDIREIMTALQNVLGIDLGDYYRTYPTIRERKRDRTAFLNSLIEKLLRKMNENDN